MTTWYILGDSKVPEKYMSVNGYKIRYLDYDDQDKKVKTKPTVHMTTAKVF